MGVTEIYSHAGVEEGPRIGCGVRDRGSLPTVKFLVKGVHDFVEFVHLGVNFLVNVVDFLMERVELSMQCS
jgi:hypothetical protein